ncbi:MAG: methyltransferase, partial [Rhodospirillaceae bacterium]|nr:methyltransferase [Rhodospirillaceae bacterium]
FLDMDPAEIAKGIKPGGTLTAELGGHPYMAPLPALAPVILRLCDGRSLAEMLAAIRAESRPDLSEDDFRTQFAQFFTAFQGVNRMVLRSPEE